MLFSVIYFVDKEWRLSERFERMAFLDHVLEPPSYGWKTEDGELYVPSKKELFSEFLSRINVFRDRKNWLPLMNWLGTLSLAPFFLFFLFQYAALSWTFVGLFATGFVYGMVLMGSHGTVWYHRYGTHRAFTFSHPFWRFMTRNLVLKIVPEEIYIVSHHVHHARSEQPGDPYNSLAGGLYCFLADTNHQPIARDLSEQDYKRIVALVEHTGLRINSYEQYQKWGSIAHPLTTVLHFLLNWSFWFFVFYMLGGLSLAMAIFAGAYVWAVGIRTYNFTGHGEGKDKRKEGWDFNQKDLSVNQYWPGIVAGEWHNNHHLFPNGARSGFLPQQIDFPWMYVRILHFFGAVDSFRDYKKQFYEKYYLPYLESKKASATNTTEASTS